MNRIYPSYLAVQTMVAAEKVLECINPDLLRLQRRWWISFSFGPTPQRPHESYDIMLHIKG